MSVAGIIFSNVHDANIPELTRNRTLASVPFGCRYRLIDFALSKIDEVNEFLVQDVYDKYEYDEIINRLTNIFQEDSASQSEEAVGEF